MVSINRLPGEKTAPDSSALHASIPPSGKILEPLLSLLASRRGVQAVKSQNNPNDRTITPSRKPDTDTPNKTPISDLDRIITAVSRFSEG